MRLWHKNLIAVLPDKQLLGQWRELAAIAGSIKLHGTPNHGLVNFVMDYDFDHFMAYTYLIKTELNHRGFTTTKESFAKISSLKNEYKFIKYEDIYKEKMNNEYLLICIYNLYEKYLCGLMSEAEWQKIKDYMH